MMGRRGGGSPGSYGLRRRGSDPICNIELMMECYDDPLTPSQILACKQAKEEYRKSLKLVEAAKAGKYFGPDGQALPIEPQQVKVINETSSSPDLIIVGETPPTHTRGRKQLQATPPPPPITAAIPPPPPLSMPAPLPPPPALQHAVSALPPGQNRPQLLATNTHLVGPVLPVPQQVFRFVNYGQTSGANIPQNNQWVLRPIMPVAPQQVQKGTVSSVQQASPPVSGQLPSIVSGTSGLGIKRPPDMPDLPSSPSPPAKRQRKRTHTETDGSGNWVPLDEYYYGKMEGDPTYTEEKGEHRFKCWMCTKMLYNNVKAMMHLQGHIDSEKQQTLDLSDLTQCRHCYKQFDTPFEMQTHIEKVHMNNVNVLMCRICEKDHETRTALTTHMRQHHCACEMPYVCQLCNFRSSMYSDVVDHFKKKHDSSDNLLCLYCLRVFRVKFVSQGWGQTQVYYHHLLRHQSKTNNRKCTFCKLSFFSPQELKTHRKTHHLPNQKGIIGANAKYSASDQVMIKVPESGLQPKKSSVLKSLNAPAVSKVTEHRGLRMPQQTSAVYCFECKMLMSTADHYKKYIQCSMCRFATSCSFAYAAHMMSFHSGQSTSVADNVPSEHPLQSPLFCACGFASKYGNKIANHLVFCSKRTCSVVKPEVMSTDKQSEDEQRDPRHKAGASILDVLGLVKKSCISSSATEGEEIASRELAMEDEQNKETENVKMHTIRRQRRDIVKSTPASPSGKGPKIKQEPVTNNPAEEDRDDSAKTNSVSDLLKSRDSPVPMAEKDVSDGLAVDKLASIKQELDTFEEAADNSEVFSSAQGTDNIAEGTASGVLAENKEKVTLPLGGRTLLSHAGDSAENKQGDRKTRGDDKKDSLIEEMEWARNDSQCLQLALNASDVDETCDSLPKQRGGEVEGACTAPLKGDADVDCMQQEPNTGEAEPVSNVLDKDQSAEDTGDEPGMEGSSEEDPGAQENEDPCFVEVVNDKAVTKDQTTADQPELVGEEAENSLACPSPQEVENIQAKTSFTGDSSAAHSPCAEDSPEDTAADNQHEDSCSKEPDILEEASLSSGLADEARSLDNVPRVSSEEEGVQSDGDSKEVAVDECGAESASESIKMCETSKEQGECEEVANLGDQKPDVQSNIRRPDTQAETLEPATSGIHRAEGASSGRSSDHQTSRSHSDSRYSHERHSSRQSDGRDRSYDRWRDNQNSYSDRRDKDRDTSGNCGQERYSHDRSHDRQRYSDWQQRDRQHDPRYDSHHGRNHHQRGGYQHDRYRDHNRYGDHGNQSRHGYQDRGHRRYY